eukprot:CAMPEP_0172472282 /NCGR_PEP_ID=MMETSP1065-20121228/68257_1 /TAXON_ID=265537 /ORGANISM="Amphiprora paludosa, Strain CCMP125" /LENGTH=277 /DNA_ID=CAMNT_0013230413 /DNA_START=534 /DNA_END=1370 /DNA_ORIENTATION=+
MTATFEFRRYSFFSRFSIPSIVILLFSFPVVVHGICYCPWEAARRCAYVEANRCTWYVSYCDDTEAATECQKANWEIADMQKSLSDLIGRFLDDALENKNMTILQVAYVRSLLSLALEENKPEGDCSEGLATRTRAAGLGHACYSPELLQECAKVRDAVDDYQDTIATQMEAFLTHPQRLYNGRTNQTFFERSIELGLVNSDGILVHESAQDFLEIVRFRTSIRTARIRCASYETTTEALTLASSGYIMSSGLRSWSLGGMLSVGVLMSLLGYCSLL